MRKLFGLGLLLSTIAIPVNAETLTVVIENVKVSEGHIMLRVLSGEKEFKGDIEAITSIKQRAMSGAVSFTIGNLPAGEYAVQIMHDSNDNGELDSNLVGMPTEPWAFSNNAAGNFGPPKWNDVKFDLTGTIVQSIRLNH
jgi:uncharacterized protein (DUF2141 family)